MKQEMNAYTSEDKWVWKTLFNRQLKNIPNKAAHLYLQALDEMKPVLNADEIPDFNTLNAFFESTTGWQIEVVPGLIEVEDFFRLLAEKKFCSSTWLRSKDSLDYLEEPDMFHDIFGHIPLLSQPVFSDFVHAFGKLGLANIHDKQKLLELQRLYWFTIEFGLIVENDKVKSYGAGILSSYGETNQIDQGKANFLAFNRNAIFQKEFRTDIMQEDYYVIQNFEELLASIQPKIEKEFVGMVY